jgi:hypothetical protein
MVQNNLQFRGLSLIQKLDDRFKRLVDIIECRTCKRCFDMAEKPEVGRHEIRTA